jgi:hypothetical protein
MAFLEVMYKRTNCTDTLFTHLFQGGIFVNFPRNDNGEVTGFAFIIHVPA